MTELNGKSLSAATESGFKGWCLRHIARPQPAQEFVPQIDGLRCVAIMAVLLYHIHEFVEAKVATTANGAAGFWQRVMAEGGFGVPLFFALSGYILCRPFLGGRKVSVKRYFTRRLSRLEPPYLISLLLVFAAKIWFLNVAFGDLFPNLLASLIYCHNLIFAEHSLVNGVAWSLEVEWQFYLLAPVIFVWVARSSGWHKQIGLGLLIALGGWAYAARAEADPRVDLSLLSYIGFFMAGTWVAVMDEEHGGFGRDSLWMDVLGIAVWLVTLKAMLTGGHWYFVLPALTALIVLTGVRGYFFRKLLGWWPIYCIGAMCYTIYLYHFFVVSALGRVFVALVGWPATLDQALLVFCLIAVPAVLVACLVPYLLIERPFMVWRSGQNRLIDAFRSKT